MSEAPTRVRLLDGLSKAPVAPPAPLPEERIAETAARHGFAEPPAAAPAAAPAVAPTATGFRRERKVTGRSVQFNVRVKPETMEAIYAEANERDIPLGQVLEEAMALLRPARD